MNIKEIVKDNIAVFAFYTDGNLWYDVYKENEKVFSFPIPIGEDTRGGVFLREYKAITLMRWIRKHKELIDSGGIE